MQFCARMIALMGAQVDGMRKTVDGSILALLLLGLGGLACSLSSPTATPKPRATQTHFLTPATTHTASPRPTASPSPTASASPTHVKTSTPTSTPTRTSTPTVTQTPTPTPLVPPPPLNGGACANPLYPFISGNQWIYQITYGGETQTVGLTVAEVLDGKATLDVLDQDTGITSRISVMCDNGSLLDFPVVLFGLVTGEEAIGNVQVTYVSGVFVPNYITFVIQDWDASWDGSYLTNGTVVVNDAGTTYTGTLENSPLQLTWKTAGEGEALFEAVTVLAGNYPKAIKVTRNTVLNLKVSMSDLGSLLTFDAVLTLDNTLWFEPNVGLLKQQVDQANLTVLGSTYPVLLGTDIELVQFIPPK